jgi:hypothetical protein
MNLVFFDRTSARQAPTGLPVLTVRRDGNFMLTAAAVAIHELHEQRWVRLAQCTDTRAWFLVFGAGPDEAHPFPLRYAKGKSPQARAFSSAAIAKVLCEAFGLASNAKTLRLQVGNPQLHEAKPLYQLLGENAPASVVPPLAPAAAVAPVAEVVAPAATDVVPAAEHNAEPSDAPPVDAPPIDAQPASKRILWRTEEIDYLRQHYPATSLPVLAAHLGRTEAAITFKAGTLKLKKQPVLIEATPLPAATPPPVAVATPAAEPAQPRKTFGLQARAEELTTYWIEREIDRTTPNELGEILNLLRHVARDKRGFEMDVVLERAEKEHTDRLRGAGKGGRNA